MQVILAESAGFCYGVKRAVELAQKTAEETQGCWMLGDLIHNTHVVNDLAARGIRKTDRPETLGAGDTVVIRSHGELKSVLDGLAAPGRPLRERHLSQRGPHSGAGVSGGAGGTAGGHHRRAAPSGGHGTCQLVRSSAGVPGAGGCGGMGQKRRFSAGNAHEHRGADHLYS